MDIVNNRNKEKNYKQPVNKEEIEQPDDHKQLEDITIKNTSSTPVLCCS